MAKWWAIPLNDDGREMLGTHGSVTVNGKYILAASLPGNYKSRETCIRYLVKPYGIPGVTYQLYIRTDNANWIPQGKVTV